MQNTNEEKIGVEEFYRNRSVFITGGTGFVGKVLIEKLLRSCPEIGKVFVLIRPKRGQDPRRRYKDLVETQIFDHVRSNCPGQLTKIRVIEGDMLLPALGISESDLKVLEDCVTIVFNAAAIIRFDEPLKSAIEMNVKGVKKVLNLCTKLKRLEFLVHVSTAYVNLRSEEMGEETNSLNCDAVQLIRLVEKMEEKDLPNFTASLLESLKLPNTYTLVKCLGEQILQKEPTSFQISIIRPTIVACAFREPIPGWADSKNGPAELAAAAGLGFLQTVYGDTQMKTDYIPVEYPVNLMIAAPWGSYQHRPGRPKIFTIGTGSLNPLRWKEYQNELKKNVMERPTIKAVWPPEGCLQKSLFLYNINMALFHFIPAFFIDLLLRLCGRKPMLPKNGTRRSYQTYDYSELRFEM